ncbi:MAG: M48 family metalloprotease [Acidobacteria bacterium]|nr:M48 family metalloprotease [Acidobacteriota bacterium]
MRSRQLKTTIFAASMIWAMALAPMAAYAQTKVSLPKNKYKVEDDVKLGRDASAQVDQQFPLINDRQVSNYIEDVGARLVSAIPQQFRQSQFQYSFKVVNASDINAFALPGGPMYVNRGMIEAAKNEGEMAGVMAHEISHVALRHATAQATKQGSWQNQLGTIGLILGGAILGGQTGAQLGMLGAAVWQTKYSREYETQSDILGAQIMANAGYDPRDLANMFQTIAGQGGGRGPEWLSSHPDPGNRFQKINNEARYLRVSPNPIKITAGFESAQARLRRMPAARTMAEIQQSQQSQQPTENPMAGGRYSNNVPAPSRNHKVFSGGNWLRMNVPSNWREFGSQSSVSFAPEGAYGNDGITHGLMLGIHRGQNNNLSRDSQELINGLLQANTYLRQQGSARSTRLGGRSAIMTTLSGRSPIYGGTEIVTIYTAQLRSGETFYLATVTPQTNSSRYNSAFRTAINSVRFND